MFTKLSEHFEFRHFRLHYLDVDTIFGDLWLECLHQHVVRNTIFRRAPPSVVSGYGTRSINLNKVVATFEKHIFLSQTDLTTWIFILWELHSKILVGDKNLL
jgi:hypothetical protein